MKLFPIFYAPEGGESGISAAASPTGTAVPEAPVQTGGSTTEIIQPAPEPKPIRQPGVKTSKLDVAKELGLKAPPSELVAAEAKKVRDAATGKYAKLADLGKKPEEPVKLGEPTPKPEPKPAPKPVEAVKVEPVKVKIGSEEKTSEEWEKHFKELAEKAEKAGKPPEEPVVAKKPEEIEAEQKKTRDEWLAKTAARFTLDQKAFDKAIADGDPKPFGELIARAIEEQRQWVAEVMQPHLEKITGFDSRLNPLLERDQQIAAYQAESEFLEQNQDIKGHAQGLKIMREVAQELHNEHDDILQLLAVNPQSPNAPRYQTRAQELEKNFLTVLQREVKTKLGITGTPPVAVVAPVAAPVAKPRPPAQGGQIGGQNAPRKSSDQGSQIQEMAARGYF